MNRPSIAVCATKGNCNDISNRVHAPIVFVRILTYSQRCFVFDVIVASFRGMPYNDRKPCLPSGGISSHVLCTPRASWNRAEVDNWD